MSVFTDDDYTLFNHLGIDWIKFEHEDAVTLYYTKRKWLVYRDGIRLWNTYSLDGWRKFHEKSSLLKFVVEALTDDEFMVN